MKGSFATTIAKPSCELHPRKSGSDVIVRKCLLDAATRRQRMRLSTLNNGHADTLPIRMTCSLLL
jgi:hypothetical protein